MDIWKRGSKFGCGPPSFYILFVAKTTPGQLSKINMGPFSLIVICGCPAEKGTHEKSNVDLLAPTIRLLSTGYYVSGIVV